ncbi:MAG: hypothetical protein D6746_10860 [Bacteroidetes bacterium]|nr:MAG: hypothetical protein D6746_10860 [Bacteroidota bacterium]
MMRRSNILVKGRSACKESKQLAFYLPTSVLQQIHFNQTSVPKPLLALTYGKLISPTYSGTTTDHKGLVKHIIRLARRKSWHRYGGDAVFQELERLQLAWYNEDKKVWQAVTSRRSLMAGDINVMMRVNSRIAQMSWTQILTTHAVASFFGNAAYFKATDQKHMARALFKERMRALFNESISEQSISHFKKSTPYFKFVRMPLMNTIDSLRTEPDPLKELPPRFDGPSVIQPVLNAIGISVLPSWTDGLYSPAPGIVLAEKGCRFSSPRFKKSSTDNQGRTIFLSLKDKIRTEYEQHPYVLPNEDNCSQGSVLFQVKLKGHKTVAVFQKKKPGYVPHKIIVRDIERALCRLNASFHNEDAIDDLAMAVNLEARPERARTISLATPSKRKPVASLAKTEWFGLAGRCSLQADGSYKLVITYGLDEKSRMRFLRNSSPHFSTDSNRPPKVGTSSEDKVAKVYTERGEEVPTRLHAKYKDTTIVGISPHQ